MAIKHKQIEIVLILVVGAVITNLLVDFGIVTVPRYPFYNQMFFLSIGYVCLSKLLSMHSKHKTAMILGQCFFILICILLYYSETVIDYIAFMISAYTVTGLLVATRYEKKIKETEQ